MSNSLTGDFDIVAEFAVAAANRLLAAMHRTERFPHSIAARVDDHVIPDFGITPPSVVSVMDSYGDPISNHQIIGIPTAVLSATPSANAAFLNLDPVVNVGDLVFEETPIVPSNLQGRVQLQVFPPRIEVPDNSGTNVRIRMETIARYFPDPNTSALAEFVRGEMKITAPVTQVASQVANVVAIDIKHASVGIDFTPTWSSRPLPAEDLLGISLLVRNALKTSFLPSNSTLPQGVSHVQFKTMNGPQPALAVLLNKTGAAGNRASATNVFIGGSDFAFGVSADFVKGVLQPTLDKMLATPIDPIKFKIDTLVHTWTITYFFTLNSATVALENGAIVITMTGHAHTSSWTPDFDFTVKAPFTIEPAGDTANLVAGDVSFDTSSWIIDRFRGAATSSVEHVRDQSLSQSGAQGTVHDMLSAKKNLGQFLESLLQPVQHGNAPPLPPIGFSLGYSSVDISPAGILLRGNLTVANWPIPHVEFEEIPANGGDRAGIDSTSVNSGPDYSALKSWIPGGTVSRYEWKSQGQTQPGFADQNKFVLLHQPPPATMAFAMATPMAAYTPMCLTVHGTRLSSSGPVVSQTVEATVCGIHQFPISGEFFQADHGRLAIALVQPSPDGLVHVAGHTAALPAETGRNAPNLIVHIGNAHSAAGLEKIVAALSESRRVDAATAILAILSADDIAKAKFTPGVTYADDRDGAWLRRFGVESAQRPITLIVTPGGKVVWKETGDIDVAKLAEALRTSLVPVGKLKPMMRPSAVRIGQKPPNFLFEYAAGQEVTMRKVEGRQIAIVFWRSDSKQSIEQVHRIDRIAGAGKSQVLVLAINDGESAEVAKRVAGEQKLSATIVPDPSRKISLAYGVSSWPTTIWVDELGAARTIQLGDFGGDAATSPFEHAADKTIEQRGAKQ